jgi:heme/copper-type cytochrome/quinol oxidase subunit 2
LRSANAVTLVNYSEPSRKSKVKKIELHMDALITMVAVFVIAISFLVYQRYQYSTLLQENLDLLWENSSLEANLVLKTAQFDKSIY